MKTVAAQAMGALIVTMHCRKLEISGTSTNEYAQQPPCLPFIAAAKTVQQLEASMTSMLELWDGKTQSFLIKLSGERSDSKNAVKLLLHLSGPASTRNSRFAAFSAKERSFPPGQEDSLIHMCMYNQL